MGLNGFVRWTRKLELADQNQLPAGTLGSKTRGLVAPSGCCLESGIDSRRSERVGSRKQGCNDQTHFGELFNARGLYARVLIFGRGHKARACYFTVTGVRSFGVGAPFDSYTGVHQSRYFVDLPFTTS